MILIVGAVVGYLAIGHTPPSLIQPTACTAGTGPDGVQLAVGQASIAATIAGVADRQHMPTRAVAIAYATALQESDLADLHYGDRDSVGIFQQRPSQGWGTDKEIENPVYASSRFFTALTKVPGYRHLPISKAAQDVQHSADGSAYGQYAAAGTQLATAFTGTVPHAVWCSYGSPVGKARLAAARKALTGTFGRLGGRASADPAVSGELADARQGWAVAAWLVTNAADLWHRRRPLSGLQWQASRVLAHWTAVKTTLRTPAAPADVVFG